MNHRDLIALFMRLLAATGLGGPAAQKHPDLRQEEDTHVDEATVTPAKDSVDGTQPIPPAPATPDASEPEAPAPEEPEPSPKGIGPTPAPPTSTLDFPQLVRRLKRADNLLDTLKAFVGDIRTREAEGSSPETSPCDLERYGARMLEEAGLFSADVELPTLQLVELSTSHLLYLRCTDARVPYAAKLRITKLEAALNALRVACASLDPHASLDQAYRLNRALTRSITAQALPLDQAPQLGQGMHQDGEWSVRYGISRAIETLQVPYRLQARYRTNVADGNIALEFDLTPAEAFPASAYVDGLGVVPTTGDMRQRASADYALRLGLLLAAEAFRCSERIHHVWVAAIHATPTRRTCYYSVDFDRWRFARLDLTYLDDLSEVYRSFAPMMRYEDGWLRPVRQTFHLEEERFCPSRRYVPVSLSSRRLTGYTAEQLGCNHVSALAIEEADGRSVVAASILMHLVPDSDPRATQRNVRTVLQLSADDPDPTVRSAGERVARGLIEGTLANDPWLIGEEFVRGDALTRACDSAKIQLMRQNADKAHAVLAPLLARIDDAGLYDDSPNVAYRYFNSYVERALDNRSRTDAGDRRTVLLVPDSYYQAHLLVSTALIMLGRPEEALQHTQRLIALAPFDARSMLHQVKCLEVLERDDEAEQQLCDLLSRAFEPMALGFGYYRLAYFQWLHGNVAAAQACYQCAMQYLPGATPMMVMELSILYLQHPDEVATEVSFEQAQQVLASHGIPVAPTDHTSRVFYECAQAALDAEIFPVARDFAQLLQVFSGDDIIDGVMRSLEEAPDHL